MWENLNKEKVQVANALARDQAKAAAQEKRNRDRAALEKQRYVLTVGVLTDSTAPMRQRPRLRSRRRRRSRNAVRNCVLLSSLSCAL